MPHGQNHRGASSLKAKSSAIQGTNVTYRDGAYAGTNLLSPAFSTTAVPGPLIKGNFKDANNWNYKCTDTWYYKGTINSRLINGTGPFWAQVGYMQPTSWTGIHPDWERSSVYNAALEKLNAKARGGLDLSIALAELGTTARMVRGISKVMNLAKLRRLGDTKDLANGWLQWQYGWKPLLGDIFNVADEASRVIISKIWNVRARESRPLEVSKVVMRQINGPTYKVIHIGKGKVSCTMRCAFSQSAFDLARWTSLNPVSIAWELIPYSFVVDWFLDVGSYMRNLETALLYGSAFQVGFTSELFAYDCTEDLDPKQVVDFSGYRYTVTRMQAKYRHREFYRTKLSSWPLPYPPTFKVDLGSQRLISAASLLRQLLK